MPKKILFGKKIDNIDQLIASKAESTEASPNIEEMKRLTIDISLGLHRRIKSQCALRGAKMADEIRELLEAKYGTDNNE